MAKKVGIAGLDVGTWIRFQTDDGAHHGGTITFRQGKAIRAVDAHGHQYVTSAHQRGRKIQLASIRAMSMGVFVIDTQLDAGWRSSRHASGFWKEYCYHANWTFAHERVHSLEDLRYILGKRVISEPVIIFNGHGGERSGWCMSNGDILDAETELTPHEKNCHKVLIFSSCGIGANEKLCQHLRHVFRAKAVIGYRSSINDDICFLAEPALLQLFVGGKSPANATRIVREHLDPWKGINSKHAKLFPIVCHA